MLIGLQNNSSTISDVCIYLTFFLKTYTYIFIKKLYDFDSRYFFGIDLAWSGQIQTNFISEIAFGLKIATSSHRNSSNSLENAFYDEISGDFALG
jgi:hypothetical protein